MRLLLTTACVMVAFAANSLLNRAAVGGGEIDALAFAAVRTVSGAVALVAIAVLLRRRWALSPRRLLVGAAALATYMIGFSLAYLRLDAGTGALILFGGVQLTMFGGALLGGERPPARRWAGAALALAGLAVMVWPSGPAAPDLRYAGLMALAALGWGLYSLNGRGAGDPLVATAANFVLAAPVCALAVLAVPGPAAATAATPAGLALAVISGTVTSGLGYALWYAVLPRLAASAAALAQLAVPVIALAGGAALLGEPVGALTLVAAAVVLGGVALGTLSTRR